MKLTITIEATAKEIAEIKKDMYGFTQEVEGLLQKRRMTTPIIEISDGGYGPVFKMNKKK